MSMFNKFKQKFDTLKNSNKKKVEQLSVFNIEDKVLIF